MKYTWIGILVLLFSSCEQSEPPEFGRAGEKVFFSGYTWNVKSYLDFQHGPGPNYFSNFQEDIFVDDNGYLHMKISNHGDKWYSTEVINETVMGYGKYSFVVEGDFYNIPRNTVVGLFTWDNTTFFSDGNSEVDVELSKWGDEGEEDILSYAVQPVAFSTFFSERVRKQETSPEDLIGVFNHTFVWTDTLITWKSYRGDSENEADLIASWSFDLDNPARVKEEGGNSSDPIVIPAPGPETQARINHWILTWIDAGPTDNEEQEFIVRRFDYEEL